MASNVPIAIIGMSCRFSGDATSPEKLWKMCAESQSGWSKIPEDRFNVDAFYHPNGQKLDTLNIKGGHFLKEDVGLFDAHFFNYTSDLAAAIDPQFRLQLESTFEAMESAGLTIQDVKGSNTSVFAGSFFGDYSDMNIRDPETLPRALLVGVGSAMASNRLSHFYDLRGPSMTVDTGCSTTLTAFHQACQSLASGESDMSIVGASNVILNPDNFMVMSASFLSEAGRCFAFDSRASGYGRGEGTATIILKRLDDALKNGDPIRAIVRSTAVNQDGKTETITTPSPDAQTDLIRECYAQAGLDPALTTYFEAHGTGTPTGDPIEARAVAANFASTRKIAGPLKIGSVKTNIGHTETVSGLASIIKVTMALEKGYIPPSINFEKPNPNIPFDEYNLKVATKLEAWPRVNGIRRASINNFGYGGANAHVVIEDYESFLASKNYLPTGSIIKSLPAVSDDSLSSKVFVLSAKDEQATLQMAADLKQHLQNIEPADETRYFSDLAYTLGQRRTRFPWITALPSRSLSELTQALDSAKAKPAKSIEPPKIGFVFTGQGAQWWAMGKELIETYPVYKQTVLEAEGYLREFGCQWSLIDEFTKSPETTNVNELAYSTPLCAVLQIALVRLLASWGVKPNAITSHSSGEVAAAYAAGALTLRSAMAIVFARGQVAGKKIPGVIEASGGMVATGLGPEALEKYIARVTSGQVMVACLNSPTSTTASGDAPAVEELERLLKEDDIFARRLKINAAYHSHHMQVLAKPYLDWLQKLFGPQEHMDNNVIYSSPTTGKRETSGRMISDPQHWVNSFANPVRFVESFHKMCFPDSTTTTSDVDIVIEVGPHAALGGPIQEIVAQPNFHGCKVQYLPSLVRKSDAVDTMQTLAASLLKAGFPVDMAAVNFPKGQSNGKVLYDLPSYPWTHKTRHWSEPRVNKAHRHRVHAANDLLGSLVLGTNMTRPSWRHVIRLNDLPWLRDHVVQSTMLYPGAGFICMAIEGAAQLAQDRGDKVTGYQLRDIEVLKGLQIPDTAEGIEVQLTLEPCNDKAIYAAGCQEFHVYSVNTDEQWTEHCKGLIQVETASIDAKQASIALESRLSQLSLHKSIEEYRKSLNPMDVYDAMHFVQICHGPIFQNLDTIKVNGRQSIATFSVADTAATMPYRHESDYIVHPTTIDSLFQAAYAGYIAVPDANMSASFIPRVIKKLYVAHNIPKKAGHQFTAYCDVVGFTQRSFDTDLIVVGENEDGSKTPLLKIDHYITQSLGNVKSTSGDAYDKLSTLQWGPDLSFPNEAYLGKQLAFETDALTNLKRVCFHFIQDAVDALTIGDVAQLKSHHKKYYVWIKLQRELALQDKLAENSSKWLNDTPEERAALAQQVFASGKVGEDICRYGPQILPILRGEIDPVDIEQADVDVPVKTLNSSECGQFHAQVAEYVRLFTHQNPRSKILEIAGGAGTVATTILQAIGVENDFLAESYTFTEKNSELLSAGEEKFGAYAGLVQCKQLDVEEDISKQGFESNSYNLIILSDAQQVSGNLEANLKNIRKLLAANGKILILEESKLPFILGLFPESWTAGNDDERPALSSSAETWTPVLKTTGFNSVEATIPESRNKAFSSFKLIVATAANATSAAYSLNVALVLGSKDTPPEWVDGLKATISDIIQGDITVEPLESLDPTDKVCIYLGDIERSILKDPSHEEFEAVKNLCVRSKGLIWITRGGAVDCQNLDASLSQGFLRTLRTEYAGRRAIALDLDPETEPFTENSITTIASIFKKSFDYSQKGGPMDFEYAERDGTVHVPRFYKDVERNSLYFPDPAQPPAPKPGRFFQEGRPLRLQVGVPGLLDTLTFGDDIDAVNDLPDGFIEIEPKVFGVNFRDIMTAMGQLQSDFMGFECSGIVKKISPAASESGLQVGDRVTTLMKGHYSSAVRVPWTSAVKIPDTLSFEIAASLPMAYATAYVSLFELARLEKGEKVLIHAAMGGVGQAAINLAKKAGAEIFATVGSAEKREALISQYGIPDDHIFSSRSASFATGVLAATGGKGVDVVLNSLAGNLLQESFDCLAQFGRFVEIGKRDLELNNSLQMQTFTRNVSFFSLDLIQLEDHKGKLINRVMKEVVRLYAEGAIATAVPFTTYPLNEIGKPFRLMQAGKHMGRIVVTVEPDVVVPIIPRKPTAHIDGKASYLVVGGLGGIGRSVCQWLAERGARNLIVLSRSANAEKVRPFSEEMQQIGCKVYPVACDISDSASMARALEDCRKNMPPIRGIIQGAMVLQDSIMEQMTVEQYMAAVRPKVQGTWNLHEQFLGQELDFFVMLSSLSGIVGLPSQCNYAAGGSYEDALTRYRIMRGLPAAVVDIGVVQAVGVVAENQDLAEGLRRLGYKPLIEDHVLTSIESIIADPPKSQVLIGLDGADWESSGLIRDCRFTPLKVRDSAQSNAAGAGAGAGELSGLLASASSKEVAVAAVTASISKKLVEIFLMAEEDVDPSKPPTTYGVDSLSAVELRNMLSLKAGAEVSIFKIMQSGSITDLAAAVVASSSFVDPNLLAA